MTAENSEAILLRHDENGICTLTLNRPGQYNCLSEALLDALLGELEAIAGDESARVVILAGNGRAFCAGHDLKEMRSNDEKAYFQALFAKAGQLMTAIMKQPQPVIARVHGVATAAGCQLVASCDLAVAAEEARFAVSGIKVGLFCATPSVALARNLGRKRALEMLLTGEFIGARQAAEEGLINHAVPLDRLDAEIARLTDAICAKSAAAIRLGKQLYYRQLELGVEEAYRLASDTMACNMMLEDAGEGIDAFMEKRPPDWKHQ